MTTLFHPAMLSTITRSFGDGLVPAPVPVVIPAGPRYHAPTAADLAWWAAESAATSPDQGCTEVEYFGRDGGFFRRMADARRHPLQCYSR